MYKSSLIAIKIWSTSKNSNQLHLLFENAISTICYPSVYKITEFWEHKDKALETAISKYVQPSSH